MTAERKYWIDTLCKISFPVLEALAEGRLHRDMPVENGRDEDRSYCTHLEALGRTVNGFAAWIGGKAEDPWERKEQEYAAEICRRAISSAFDPDSPDFCDIRLPDEFGVYSQPLVDLAFLSQGILRAKGELFDKLPDKTKENLVNVLKMSRRIHPIHNNWLLFSAMVEAALYVFEGECDMVRVDFALTMHEEWYKGGGVYGDGPLLCRNYYNSFVIHPMLIDIMETVGDIYPKHTLIYEDKDPKELIYGRAQSYARHLEALIAPDGSFPAIGRSITYRMGAFHLLSQLALLKRLPDSLSPASVRCALGAVIRRGTEAKGTFDENGWLRIGLCGSQRELAEGYISTGSLYLCTAVFLALGLPESDPFWSDADEDWSWKRIWN